MVNSVTEGSTADQLRTKDTLRSVMTLKAVLRTVSSKTSRGCWVYYLSIVIDYFTFFFFFIYIVGRSPGEGNGNPLQYSCL